MLSDQGSFPEVLTPCASPSRWPLAAATVLVSLALAACGGGGSSGASSAAPESSAVGLGNGSSESSADPDGSGAATATESSDGFVSAAATGGTSSIQAVPGTVRPTGTANRSVPTTASDAVRLADQATFGPTEALVADIKVKGPSAWLISQMVMPQASSYTSGSDGSIHQSP
jgi:hypothetical protein